VLTLQEWYFAQQLHAKRRDGLIGLPPHLAKRAIDKLTIFSYLMGNGTNVKFGRFLRLCRQNLSCLTLYKESISTSSKE
jgi:hypothetical protein